MDLNSQYIDQMMLLVRALPYIRIIKGCGRCNFRQ